MVADFNFYLPPVSPSRPEPAFPIERVVERRANRLFLGIVLAVAVALLMIAGFFAQQVLQ